MRTVMSSADKGFWALSEKDWRMRAAVSARSRMPALNTLDYSKLSLWLACAEFGAGTPKMHAMPLPLRRDFSARRGRCARSLPVLKKPEPQKWRNSPPAMDLTSETPAIIEFGHFRVVPHRRELLADGQPIHLGGRTFDMLMALIEEQGA